LSVGELALLILDISKTSIQEMGIKNADEPLTSMYFSSVMLRKVYIY